MDLATFGFDALATDRQSETQPRSVVASPFEWAKQFGGPPGRQASALVLDLDQYAILGRRGLQRYVTMGTGELQRVLQQVGNRRREERPVDVHVHPRLSWRDG